MKNKTTSLLLINVGTPDKPNKFYVWKYLTEFLNDKYVIDIPLLFRFFLVNFIIIPSRINKSTRLYKKLWTKNGSPLLYYSIQLKKKLENILKDEMDIFIGMRYGNPSLKKSINEINKKKYNEVIILPLYPQYAQSTTQTSIEIVKKKLKYGFKKIIYNFYDKDFFINSIVSIVKSKYDINTYDYFIFSFHGLPLRQLKRSHPLKSCNELKCEYEINESNKLCYKAQCYHNARLISKKTGIPVDKYTVSFQSRLDKNWMSPFTDKELIKLAQEGKSKILVFCLSFVADCLETIIEIGMQYKQLFKEYGGEKLDIVEGLNDNDIWINNLAEYLKFIKYI